MQATVFPSSQGSQMRAWVAQLIPSICPKKICLSLFPGYWGAAAEYGGGREDSETLVEGEVSGRRDINNMQRQ